MLTTKTLYSLVALADMINNGPKGPVKIKDISKRQGLSHEYLEQLAKKLKKAGLIKSILGPKGGYLPCKNISSKTMNDIIAACGERIIQDKRTKFAKKTKEVLRAQELAEELDMVYLDQASKMELRELTTSM